MNRSIIYVWSTGYWIYGVDYHYGTHSVLGNYQEVVIGEGWHTSEISQMVRDFVEENIVIFE